MPQKKEDSDASESFFERGNGNPQNLRTNLGDFWEYLYFLYVIKLNRPEEEFFKSTPAKVIRMIELEYLKYKGIPDEKNQVKEVNSIREFL